MALGNALVRSRSMGEGVHWQQLWTVLKALALSPVLGFLLAGGLYLLTRKTVTTQTCTSPRATSHRCGGCAGF